MRKILNKFLSTFLCLWSYSIVFALTDDDRFGTVEYKNNFCNDIKCPRISLLNIMFGDKLFYILSFTLKEKKFKIFVKLSLEEKFNLESNNNDIENILERYADHLNADQTSECDIEIEREALCYRIENQEKRIDKSSEKINLYASVILTVLPLILAIIDLKEIFYLNMAEKIIIIIIGYVLLNIIAYIFQSIKIQSIWKSKFSDLKKSEYHSKELNKQYFHDWKFLQENADLSVSYVKNIQNWIIGLICCFIILYSINLISNYLENINSNNTIFKGHVINFLIDEMDDTYSDTSIAMTQLNFRIQKKYTNKIIMITNDKKRVKKLVKEMENKYKNLNIQIFVDKNINENIVKILEDN